MQLLINTSFLHFFEAKKRLEEIIRDRFMAIRVFSEERYEHLSKGGMYITFLLLLLSWGTVWVPLFFFKSGTLILAFFCITIIGDQEYHITSYHTTSTQSAFAMPSLCLRFRRRREVRSKS